MQHIYHVRQMLEIDADRPGNTRIVFIHRDGRDVAASLKARGSTWKKAITRWVKDNNAIIPYLNREEILSVSFEDFTNASRVLDVLRQVRNHLNLDMNDAELILSLLPGTQKRNKNVYCTSYPNDMEKMADLGRSLLSMMPLHEDTSHQMSDTVVEEKQKLFSFSEKTLLEPLDPSVDPKKHDSYRTWQMSQMWSEIVPPQSRNWSKEITTYFCDRADAQLLMERFQYPVCG